MKQPHKISQRLKHHNSLACLFAVIVGLSGCATYSAPGGHQTTINNVDPFEHANRKIYVFNDAVDDYVAKPISDTYKVATPQFAQTGIANFFNNLQNINVVINDFLQAKFVQGAQDTQRLLMNTTLGLAGFIDVARSVGLDQNEEDFEQTLAVWGVPQGDYLVLPFLGPITFRGIPGAVFDTLASPITYVGAPLLSNFIGTPIQALSLINKRANAEGALKFIDEAALDPYVFTRASFLQWRTHLANDGKTEADTDLFDIEEDK
ncbi:MAG: VacJ family lipoprotein [Methylococcales bacterium]